MFFEGIRPKEEKCCGCLGCVETCPHSALKESITKDGFIIPEVDPNSCIECGACEKVCPMRHADKVINTDKSIAYAAINKNIPELLKSSSGGIFSVIADYVLSQNGIVYGASFDDKMQLTHIAVDSTADLEKLRGSKYLQSKSNLYKDIRKQLKNGKLVYYCGTGCQVAALKLFLVKDYHNLITSDILCHGTPPQKVFDFVIKTLEKKYKGKVVQYQFRDKSVWGWSCSSSSSSIKKNNKTIYIGLDSFQDAYFNAFIMGVMNRESCYVCPYAQGKRCGDITLADFWGVEKYIPIQNKRAGVSAIFVNNKKGEDLIKTLEGAITLYPAKFDDIAIVNQTLVKPTERPKERNLFFEKFHTNPFMTINEYKEKQNIKRRMVYLLRKNKITNHLINILKSLK